MLKYIILALLILPSALAENYIDVQVDTKNNTATLVVGGSINTFNCNSKNNYRFLARSKEPITDKEIKLEDMVDKCEEKNNKLILEMQKSQNNANISNKDFEYSCQQNINTLQRNNDKIALENEVLKALNIAGFISIALLIIFIWRAKK